MLGNQIFVTDKFGSLHAVLGDPEFGNMLVGLDNTDITVSTSGAGDVAHDAADSGNPVKIGGKARTANPTAVAANDRVDGWFDVVGRQVMTPYAVRDLISTGAATLANNAADNETEVLVGAPGVFHDLVYISVSNASANAVRVVFRGTTAGTDLFNVTALANETEQLVFTPPQPQAHADASWVVDFDTNANIADANDVTNTTVSVFLQAINNV